MLDSEARALLDLMEKAVQDGRPRLETLPYKEGRDGGRQDVGGQRGRAAWRSARSTTAASRGRAARSASAATGRSVPPTGRCRP